MKKVEYCVAFLPFVPSIDKEIELQKVVFWPFWLKKDEFIRDVAIRNFLEKYFRLYCDHYKGTPLKHILVVSFKNRIGEFSPLSDEEIEKVQKSIYVLTFSCIFDYPKYVNSDAFQYYFQKFDLKEGIATHGKHITTFKGLRIVKPLCVKDGFGFGKSLKQLVNDTVLRALEKMMVLSENPEILEDGRNEAERIIRSLMWFFCAHSDADSISLQSKIVIMATAFEALLKLNQNEITEDFRNKIRHLLGNKDDPKEKRGKEETTLKEWWATKFYELRSDIVHGRRIKAQDLIWRKSGRSHLELSDIFFKECVKEKLSRNKKLDLDRLSQIILARGDDINKYLTD